MQYCSVLHHFTLWPRSGRQILYCILYSNIHLSWSAFLLDRIIITANRNLARKHVILYFILMFFKCRHLLYILVYKQIIFLPNFGSKSVAWVIHGSCYNTMLTKLWAATVKGFWHRDVIIIIIPRQCLWCCHLGRAIARVYPVYLMNVERRPAAANPRPNQTT